MILSEGVLTCILVQANYEAGCSSSYTFSLVLHRDFSVVHLDVVLGSILKTWSKEIDWDLVSCQDELCLLSLDDSESVGGATLIVDPYYLSEGPIHSYVMGVDAIMLEDQLYIDMSAKLLDVSGASELVYVVAGWNDIRVLIAHRGRSGLSHEGKIIVRELKIDSDALDKIVESSMEHVLSIRLRKDEMIDIVANLRDRRPVGILSEQIQDVARAFLTAALIHMRDIGLQSFGTGSRDGLLCATGPLLRILPLSHSSLAIIDGLQLRGTFDVGIDDGMVAVAGGVSYIQKRFAFPLSGVYPHRYMYVSPEKGATGRKGESVFRGKVVNQRDGEIAGKLVLGQSGQIVSIALAAEEKLYIEPARSVFFPNLDQVVFDKKKSLVVEGKKGCDRVVVDCRSIPVVYGPDAHANLSRIPKWISSFSSQGEKAKGVSK